MEVKQKTLGKYTSNILSWLKSFYKEPLQIKKKNSDDSENKWPTIFKSSNSKVTNTFKNTLL